MQSLRRRGVAGSARYLPDGFGVQFDTHAIEAKVRPSSHSDAVAVTEFGE